MRRTVLIVRPGVINFAAEGTEDAHRTADDVFEGVFSSYERASEFVQANYARLIDTDWIPPRRAD